MEQVFKTTDNKEFSSSYEARNHENKLIRDSKINSGEKLYCEFGIVTFRETNQMDMYRIPLKKYSEIKEKITGYEKKNAGIIEKFENMELFDLIENIKSSSVDNSYYYNITIIRIK